MRIAPFMTSFNWKRCRSTIVLVFVWQVLSSSGTIPAYKLPSPYHILMGLWDLASVGMPPGHLLHHHIGYSLYRVSIGYGLAVLGAVPLGIAMGWSKTVRDIMEPILDQLRPIPPLAWIPIAILWFGIGVKSAAFIIFLGAFFPILLNTSMGVRSIDPVFVQATRMLNAPDLYIIRNVLIPGALPSVFTGMRIGLGIGWMTLVAAEITGVRQGYGLGYMIMTARDIQRPDEILAGMMVIGFMGLLIDRCIGELQRRVIRWR